MKTLIRCAPLAAVLGMALFLYGGGRASDPLAVATANAAVRCPDGFTVSVHGLPAGSEPTSSLSASCVLELGIPTGATGAQGPAGTPGADGVSGYVQRTATVKSSKSNSSERLAATAKCPAGKKAIGGGARSTINTTKSNTFRSAITTSEPTPDGQGWRARLSGDLNLSKSNINRAGHRRGTVFLRVTVICAVVR
jgi:hypothetical protein